jgi:PIN domain nuclease of toxin-antitoxin system
VRVLLDTHALLWWLAGDPQLSKPAYATIEDESNQILISAATAWEIATKVRIGKLPHHAGIARDLPTHMADQGFSGLAITIDHGQRAGMLPGPHRDPFDRMLIAQAHAEGIPLVSNEEIFDHYGVTRIW